MNQNSLKPWFPEGRVRHASLRTEGPKFASSRRPVGIQASLRFISWRCERNFERFNMCLCPEEFAFRRLKLSHPYASAFATSPVSTSAF